MSDTCVLYIVWDIGYMEKACLSLKSFRRFHPDIDAAIVTDQITEEGMFESEMWLKLMDERHLTKTYNLANFVDYTDYTKILYLDADTYVCGDLSGLFELADVFDFSLAHAPTRRLCKKQRRRDTSDAYADFNSGVMMIRNSKNIKGILNAWAEDSRNYSADQPALCELLYWFSPNISVCALPPEYNARVGFPCFFSGEVKILHAGGIDLCDASKRVNKSKGMRLWRHNVKN